MTLTSFRFDDIVSSMDDLTRVRETRECAKRIDHCSYFHTYSFPKRDRSRLLIGAMEMMLRNFTTRIAVDTRHNTRYQHTVSDMNRIGTQKIVSISFI